MVTVGVSGHRNLGNVDAISTAVDEILEKVHNTYGGNSLRVISPLAEGADRLVAKRAIELYSAQLVVPLPFEMSVYMLDFESTASKTEFLSLIELAHEVIQLPTEDSRGASFLAVGLYTLTQSEMLVAIWDGKPARGVGGTAQIVAEARKLGKPMAWIEVEDRGENVTSNWNILSNGVQIHYEHFPNKYEKSIGDK